MTLPNFIVIGAAKAGTTSLCFQLGKHRDVFMSRPKEPNYFSRSWPSHSAQWYEDLFSGATAMRAIGEGSTSYSNSALSPDAPARIFECIPHARIIYVGRHPLVRMESYYAQRISNGDHLPYFDEAVRQWRPLLDGSLYWANLSRYRRFFPDDRILTLVFEEIATNPKYALKRCFEFLGVDPDFPIDDVGENRHPRSGLKQDRWALARLRHTRPGRWFRRKAPEGPKNALRRVFRKRLSIETQWHPATRAWALELLRDDAARFLEYCGKSSDYWSLD